MSEQTSKHGPGRDERLKHEPQGLLTGGDPAQPADRRGTPPGMTQADIDTRTDIAQALGTSAFPGTREDLVVVASTNNAPDAVIGRLRSLPPGETFQNVQDVARALGLHVETRRT